MSDTPDYLVAASDVCFADLLPECDTLAVDDIAYEIDPALAHREYGPIILQS